MTTQRLEFQVAAFVHTGTHAAQIELSWRAPDNDHVHKLELSLGLAKRLSVSLAGAVETAIANGALLPPEAEVRP